jgi:hypothetical protein
MSHSRKVYGLGAEFESAADLMAAAEKVRDHGFSHWDVHTPFPIHGMDKAMGLGKSNLSAFVFVGGCLGLLTGISLVSIPSFILYPIIVHGKPFTWATFPAFFPIIFELTVLFSAFTAVGTMFAMNSLPRLHHPVFNWDRFSRFTDDGFLMVIEARDSKFSETRTKALLEEIGAKNVTLIHD